MDSKVIDNIDALCNYEDVNIIYITGLELTT